MVDLRHRQDLNHDSTIYVFSELPLSLCDEIFQSLTGASTSTLSSPVIPWNISNRYYTTQVQFSVFDDIKELQEELKRIGKDVLPAFVMVVDNSKLVDDSLLEEFNAEMIDVPLIVGKSVEPSGTPILWEDMMQRCIAKGWEYIDLSDSGDDELGGQSGISRVSEALQAHIWPMSPQNSSRTQHRPLAADSDDDDDEPIASSSRHRSRRDSQDSSSSQEGSTRDNEETFNDNFAPFISAASRDATLAAALSSPSLDDTSLPTFPSTSYADEPTFDEFAHPFRPSRSKSSDDNDSTTKLEEDEDDDPTAHLTQMFAAFGGLRERALGIQDKDKKMDFAEEIAMKFAKQLDLLMGAAADREDDEDADSGPAEDLRELLKTDTKGSTVDTQSMAAESIAEDKDSPRSSQGISVAEDLQKTTGSGPFAP